MPQVTAEVDRSSAVAAGVVTPAVLTSWPEFGLRALFRVSGGTAAINLRVNGATARSFTLPVPSGYNAGDNSVEYTIAGQYSTWDWEVASISANTTVYCTAQGLKEDDPITADSLKGPPIGFSLRLAGTKALTAAVTGKRIALGSSKSIRLSTGSSGSIYYRFVDGSGAIAVSSSDTAQAVSSSPVDIAVPSGKGYLEYLRVGGSDVSFNLGYLY